jgi:hypothetical protein
MQPEHLAKSAATATASAATGLANSRHALSLKQGQQATTTIHAQVEVIQTVVSGHTFSVPGRYDLTNPQQLGKGSDGVVVSAKDLLLHTQIAVKRVRPYAQDEWDARHTLREIRLMKLLGAHPNVSVFWLSRMPLILHSTCSCCFDLGRL